MFSAAAFSKVFVYYWETDLAVECIVLFNRIVFKMSIPRVLLFFSCVTIYVSVTVTGANKKLYGRVPFYYQLFLILVVYEFIVCHVLTYREEITVKRICYFLFVINVSINLTF